MMSPSLLMRYQYRQKGPSCATAGEKNVQALSGLLGLGSFRLFATLCHMMFCRRILFPEKLEKV